MSNAIMNDESIGLIRVKAELTALKADAEQLATLVNAYAGNLDLLKRMQELSRRILAATRRKE
jgi:hypothetical protein